MRVGLTKFVLVGMVFVGAISFPWWFNLKRDPLRKPARRAWKQTAIEKITERVTSPSWLSNELARLKLKSAQTEGFEAWLSDSLILMRSGEWLCYTNVCSKQPGAIYDLFIAYGSDGNWYYSTFHFCIEMVVLRLEEQPENLTTFCQTYYVHRFDGRSDECLKKTWPPQQSAR